MPYDKDWANQVAIQQLMGTELPKDQLHALQHAEQLEEQQRIDAEQESCGASHAPAVIREDGCVVCGYRAP
jgi:hypothetical protein